MKKVIIAAQGEITILRVVGRSGKLPGQPLAKENGRYVIGHSETGHHHVLSRPEHAVVHEVTDRVPVGMRVLRAILDEPMSLEHQRPYDTHAPIELPAGEYEFRIAREYDPYADLARRAAD